MPATQEPPPTSSTNAPVTTAESQAAQFASVKRNLSFALLVACPVLILVPPRKLDFYTIGLGGLWLASANHATYATSGRSILQRMNQGISTMAGTTMPTERAREVQKMLREEREAMSRKKSAEAAAEAEAKENEQRGVLEKIWMGGEKEGWKEKRLREEQEALNEGKGYGYLIKEQVSEVWNWRKDGKKDGEWSQEKGDGKK